MCGDPVCEDPLTLISTKCPWLITRNIEAEAESDQMNQGEESLCIVNDDEQVRFECRIPEIVGRRIRGCYHGWIILSKKQHHNNNSSSSSNYNYKNVMMWSLWNPVTSKFIRLPPLLLKTGDSDDDILFCCLSSDPDHPNSILLLRIRNKPNLVFFRLGKRKKKSRRWIEMSYAGQFKSFEGFDDGSLNFLTCSNGKVYALSIHNCYLIHVDIMVMDDEEEEEDVVISLNVVRDCPFPFISNTSYYRFNVLKGYGTDVFCITLGFDKEHMNKLVAVYLFKLDMTNTTSTWEEIKDLKDAVFYVDIAENMCVYYNHAATSELGGYIHVRSTVYSKIFSYHLKDRTVSVIAMPPLGFSSYLSLWECRLEGDDGEARHTIEYKLKKDMIDDEISIITSIKNEDDGVVGECYNSMANESHLVSIPFHILERIMEFCVGIEFLMFRATCKLCHLAAPLMHWRVVPKLRSYTTTASSPLLLVVEKNRGVMNLTDPIFGDKYFIKTLVIASHEEIFICCSRYGWLLFYSNLGLGGGYFVFFNPFTKDIHKLLTTDLLLQNLCFSAPPTSRDCMVVGFTTKGDGHAYILHFVVAAQEETTTTTIPLWRKVDLDYGGVAPYAFRFPTFRGPHLYALCNEGQLVVFIEISQAEGILKWEVVVAEAPKCCLWDFSTQYFLVKRDDDDDQHLMLVILGLFGEYLDVFQLNDSTNEWEKIESLGRHTIFISDTTCSCIEATTPKMQNKIYFPHLNTDNGKIVFYSLEDRSYCTIVDGDKIEETAWRGNYLGTKYHLNPYAWIEPTLCVRPC